jgi:FtsH-binding integral membrane protein
VVALAVFSHWLLDLVVHTQDLPLWSDTSLKLGLGLWNNAVATYLVETVLLVLALWLYLSSTSANSAAGKYGMSVFVVSLLLLNIVNIFGPLQDDSQLFLAISALTSYFLFAAVAYWLDKKRS